DMIAVQANQQVKKGQILIKLDDDKAQAALVEAKAYLQDEQRKLTEY
ncbi:biotin/lipoyl-binding protein, partial [Vibrio cholerae]